MSARPFSNPVLACSESGSFAASSAKVASAARAASWSPLASASRSRSAGPASAGASSTARPKAGSTSAGAGRCMPGIFTKPPSGIIPMPYSIPLRVCLTTAGGKPM